MTSIDSIHAWAARPIGKVARAAMALGGMLLATMVLTVAAVVSSGAWILVALGVGLAATAVRAARVPTTSTLALFAAAAIAAPAFLRILF